MGIMGWSSEVVLGAMAERNVDDLVRSLPAEWCHLIAEQLRRCGHFVVVWSVNLTTLCLGGARFQCRLLVDHGTPNRHLQNTVLSG